MLTSILSFFKIASQVVLALPEIISMIRSVIAQYEAHKAKNRKEALEAIDNAKTDEERHEALKKLNNNL